MVQINVQYEGELRCKATHGPSQQTLYTDAPLDNQGKGEMFSPTDLVATALGTCVATLMGIYGQRHELDLAGMDIIVEKEMQTDPRKIAKLKVNVSVPLSLEEKHRTGIERMARSCPVHASLHPDIDSPISFSYL